MSYSALKDIPQDAHGFKEFCDYLQKASGITITSNKSYLVSARIRHIMQEYDLHDMASLITILKKSNHNDIRQKIVDAMTTNETFWFRDIYPFDYFQEKLLPQWNDGKSSGSPIKIWSAACSSGQEPYSLGILCEEFREKTGSCKNIEILATDLSSQILDRAKLGQYDKLSVERGLSNQRLAKFFESSGQTQWTVSSKIKRYTTFRSLNLLDPYHSLGQFDFILCRNVLIYFSRETKTDILTRMHQVLKPGGLLCLGSSEGLADATDLFKMEHCKPGIMYRALEK